ncbi:MAG: aminoacyl-tRNA hydrolase [Spirochaetes bacterium]|nr:aminoacyl-tRNA hydrolase [Spirochaetota bacterium]
MIHVTDNISIDEKNLKEEFIRSSGPGGQNVNKVSTAVQLRFDVKGSGLPDEVKERLIYLAGKRITEDKILIISARRYRHQDKNRKDAVERLTQLIRRAAQKPEKRRKTKPSSASVEKRLKEKRIKSVLKKQRNSEW